MSFTVTFASPKITKEMQRLFGDRVETVTIPMRSCRDVPRFIQKVEEAHKKASKSRLVFK
jgi:hypothetical protein